MCEQLGIPMGFLPEICDCDHVVGTVTRRQQQSVDLPREHRLLPVDLMLHAERLELV